MPDPAPDFYRETHVDGPDGRRFYVFFSGDVGCLVYVDGVGGTAFHSHDPAYAGDASAVIEHFREDGFIDGFPAAWALPAESVERALAHFRERGAPAGFVQWRRSDDERAGD
ncbi:hypothetical protein ACI2IY_19805 [Lysobacter enzymogenes]|uniref:hypothetical protein n=1 Tax=Lysobacter enzymogenes TaxID=69 RepID=UPI00384CC4A5